MACWYDQWVVTGWIQKGKLLSETESGLGDSGAQISVTNAATAAKFGLQRHKYDTPIQIGFVQGAEVMMCSVLGEAPGLEAETIFRCGQFMTTVRDKVTGKIVYEGASKQAVQPIRNGGLICKRCYVRKRVKVIRVL